MRKILLLFLLLVTTQIKAQCGTDTQKPTITSCAAPININADNNACSASNVNLGSPPTVTDNCTLNLLITNNAPSVFPIGTTTVIWTVKDAAGNSTTCTQMVTVKDNQKPTITACAAPVNVVADKGVCSASKVNLGNLPVFTDNCSLTQITLTNDAPAVFPLGITTVTWTVKDAANNTTTCTQTVTVSDNQKPIVPALADVIGQCSATVVVPKASDNCAGIVTATTIDPLIYNYQGTYVVHWKFNDGNGNISTANQNVIINNNVPSAPVLADVIGQCSATVSIPTLVNTCYTIYGTTPDPLSYTSQGTFTVHWTFDDGNGSILTANQRVIIADTQKPVVTACTPAISVTADSGLCSASNVNLGTPTVSDNCTLNPVIINNAPSVFPIGITTVTWTIKDIAGNFATCTQMVTVTDNQKPIITACAVPVSVTINKDACFASNVNLGTPTVSDNCTMNPVTLINDAPATFDIGTTTVTWTVKDAAGNTATCVQIVTVKDFTLPTIAAPAAVTVNAGSNCMATGVILGTPVTADNCTVASVTNNAPTTFPIGNTNVIWTVKDWSNNTSTATQTVTVKGPDVTVTNTSGVLSVAEIGAIYRWKTCPNNLYLTDNKAYSPTQSGSYKVEVTKNGCSVTSACIEFSILGTDHFDMQDSVTIYPNPSNENITIDNFANNCPIKRF